jgi:hypothetical protein
MSFVPTASRGGSRAVRRPIIRTGAAIDFAEGQLDRQVDEGGDAE